MRWRRRESNRAVFADRHYPRPHDSFQNRREIVLPFLLDQASKALPAQRV